MQTMSDQLVAKISRLEHGKAFSAKDFLDIASRRLIDITLARLVRAGKIRRVRRGLYDNPKVNSALGGQLSPDLDEVAHAIARSQRWKIIPEGAWAANLLRAIVTSAIKNSATSTGDKSAKSLIEPGLVSASRLRGLQAP